MSSELVLCRRSVAIRDPEWTLSRRIFLSVRVRLLFLNVWLRSRMVKFVCLRVEVLLGRTPLSRRVCML